MPSRSFTTWQTTAREELDQLENTHALVGGHARGRRFTTQHINQAYTVLLSAHFQNFCRNLHSECVDHLCSQPPGTPTDIRILLLRQFMTQNRKLDTGNPNASNIQQDFGRFNNMDFLDLVKKQSPPNSDRLRTLATLNVWRNAIGHQDFTSKDLLGRTGVTLIQVRRWRTACHALAAEFDRLMGQELAKILGRNPW